MAAVPHIAIVIPCLNEAAAIAGVVTQARQHACLVIVIDDGSTDATSERARHAGAEVFRNAQPQGKGAALTRGLHKAIARGAQWAICMDGDGQHATADLPPFVRAAHGAPKMVIGSRMGAPDGMPWIRRVVNRWMSARISNLTGAALPDTQCGFRLLHLGAWAELQFDTTHFEFESEMLVAWLAAGYKVEFVPVQVIYGTEQSKIHPIRDAIRWLTWFMHAKRMWNAREARLRAAAAAIEVA